MKSRAVQLFSAAAVAIFFIGQSSVIAQDPTGTEVADVFESLRQTALNKVDEDIESRLVVGTSLPVLAVTGWARLVDESSNNDLK